MNRSLALVALMLLAMSSCTLVREVHAIQPSYAVDTPNVWVAITTNKEKLNGVYRCSDGGMGTPVCRRAALVQP